MTFDPSAVTGIYPPVYGLGFVALEWTTDRPAGTWFQVYVGRRLLWSRPGTSARIPTPANKGRVDIGAIDGPDDSQVDYSASLPLAPRDRVTLSWQGGSHLGADLAGYRIYASPSPGAAVDYDAPIADVPAYPDGRPDDGFGDSPFGLGGFGASLLSHEWTSRPYRASGSYRFGIRPYDLAGNDGPSQEVTVYLLVPPNPPARYPDSARLKYSYNNNTGQVTLTWNASPP